MRLKQGSGVLVANGSDGSGLVRKCYTLLSKSARIEVLPTISAFIVNFWNGPSVNTEKIKVRATGSGQMLEVVVLSKQLDGIEVVIGEGVHSVRCTMTPTRNRLAYAGKALGREIVYERSREDVKGDLARAAGFREFQR